MSDHDHDHDRDPVDGHAPHLGDRMERAVGGLRAPDVAAGAIARGRRQRTRGRLAYGAGSIAAATALVLTVQAFSGGLPGREQDASTPQVATDPSSTAGSVATSPTSTAAATSDPCGVSASGWWSKSSAQIKDELSVLLPEDVGIGVTDDDWTSTWGGNLTTGADADFASLTLLPPPGTPGGRMTLADVAPGGGCAAGNHDPMQAVAPCDELSGQVVCEEIRSENGTLVGVVTEKVEQTIVDGQEQPTDRSYLLATVAAPGGGHVELYVAEGTRADRPTTVHDPADVPALTMAQVRAIVTDPVWTR